MSLRITRPDAPPGRYQLIVAMYDLQTGETLPDSAIDDLRKFDAIFLGAIGHPDVKPGILEKGILLKARFALDQYINLRPVKLYPNVYTPIKDKGPDEIDFVIVRENNEGFQPDRNMFKGKAEFMPTPDMALSLRVITRSTPSIRLICVICRRPPSAVPSGPPRPLNRIV